MRCDRNEAAIARHAVLAEAAHALYPSTYRSVDLCALAARQLA
jgi:hypothetical protein